MNQQNNTFTEVNNILKKFKTDLGREFKLDENFSQKAIILLGFEQLAVEKYFQELKKFELNVKTNDVCIYSITYDQQNAHFIVCPKIHENPDQIKYFQQKLIVENLIKQYPKLTFKVVINQVFYSQLEIAKSISQITGSLLKFGNYQFQQKSLTILDLNKSHYCYIKTQLEEAKIQKFESKQCTWKELMKDVMENNFLPTKSTMESQFYGEGTILLNNHQSEVVSKINQTFSQFSKKILRWQQTVFLKVNKDKKKLFKQFLDALNLKVKCQSQNFNKIVQSVEEINHAIKDYEKDLESMRLDIQTKAKDLKIEQINIDYQILKEILKFLSQYNKLEFQKQEIMEIKLLKVNLSYQLKYFDKDLEYHLYEIRRVGGLIDQQPQQLENAVFAIGETRSGKTTLLNILKNENSVQTVPFNQIKNDDSSDDDSNSDGSQSDEGDYVYDLKQEFQNLPDSMDIGHTLVSKTSQKAYFRYKNIIFIDLPGTKDTRSELNEIALLINIFEQLKATKYPFFLFIMNGSIKDKYIELIKTSFEPILTMFKNRKDFNDVSKSNSGLIITKVKSNQRKSIIKSWKRLFEGSLDLNYSFFKEMYGNDKSCIEFLHANEKVGVENYSKYFQTLQKRVFEMVENSFDQQKKQQIKLDLELQINEKLKKFYSDCIPLISDKFEHLLTLLLIQIQEKLLSEQVDVCDLEQSLLELQCIMKNSQRNMSIMNMEILLRKIQLWLESNQISQDNNCMMYLIQVCEDVKWMILLGKYMNHEQQQDGIKFQAFLQELEIIMKLINKSKMESEAICGSIFLAIAGLFAIEAFIITAMVTAIRLLFPNFLPAELNRFSLPRYGQNLIFRKYYREYLQQYQQ